MDLSKSLRSYLEELSSDAATPGGGNVAALSATLACSLGIMVCNLTIGKKKYADVQDDIERVKTGLEDLKDCFVELAQKDNLAFDKVMESFKLPKETEEQKETRSAAIQEATFAAAVVPSEVIETCKKALPLIETAALKGNKNSVSDAGVALSLLSTGAEGALLNVIINCSSLSNKTIGNELLKKSEILCDEIKAGSSRAIANIKTSLMNG